MRHLILFFLILSLLTTGCAGFLVGAKSGVKFRGNDYVFSHEESVTHVQTFKDGKKTGEATRKTSATYQGKMPYKSAVHKARVVKAKTVRPKLGRAKSELRRWLNSSPFPERSRSRR